MAKILDAPCPFIHPKLSEAVNDSGLLQDLTEQQIKSVDAYFAQHKDATHIPFGTPISTGIHAAYDFYKFTDASGKPVICACYGTPIGEGGMGAVYLAQNIHSGKLYALKVSHTYGETLKNEARFINLASGSSTDKALLLLEKENLPKLLMELQEGVDLIDKINVGDPSFPQRIEMGFNMLSSIQSLHNKGILHRDIKPDNLMVAGTEVTPIDFGLACVASHGLESVGKFVGSRNYIAPELFMQTGLASTIDKQCTYTPKTDVYALGVTLCDLFELPYPASYVEHIQKVLDSKEKTSLGEFQQRRQSHFPKDTGPLIQSLLEKMVDPDPKKRISLTDAIQALSNLRDELLVGLYNNIKKTAVVDLNEFKKLEKEKKLEMITTLQSGKFDEVIFIDAQQEMKSKWGRYRQLFEKKGLPVKNRVLHDTSTIDILKSLHTYDNEQKARSYHCITTDTTLTNKVGNAQVCFINSGVDPAAMKTQMDQHAQKLQINQEQLKNITERLDNELNRLTERVTSARGNDIVRIQDRIKAINEMKTKLEDNFKKGTLSFATLNQHLKNLEKKMYGTGFLNWLAEKTGWKITRSTGQKVVRNIREEFTHLRPN